MPTRDAYAVAALTLLIFFVAFNLQSGWVYAVDALLAGVLVAGCASSWHAIRGVSVTRTAPPDAVEGEPVTVHLTVRAAGAGRRFLVRVSDTVPGLQPAEVLIPVLQPGRSAPGLYHTHAIRRGIHRATTSTVRSRGLTGLFEARRQVPTPSEIIVYPRYWRISRFSPAARVQVFQTAGATRRRGGLEFYGLRDYRAGDSIRHVHWRSSARRGALMVREFEQEVPGALTLLIDTRADAQAGAQGEEMFEDLIRAAASIIWYVTAHGGSIRLLASAPAGALDITGGWATLMRALAGLGREGKKTPAAVLAGASLGKEPSVIAFTSDRWALEELARASVGVTAVVAEPSSYDAEAPGMSAATRPHGWAGGADQDPVCVLRKGDDIGRRLEEYGG